MQSSLVGLDLVGLELVGLGLEGLVLVGLDLAVLHPLPKRQAARGLTYLLF